MTHDFLILGLNAEPKCESCCFSSAHFNSIVFFVWQPLINKKLEHFLYLI